MTGQPFLGPGFPRQTVSSNSFGASAVVFGRTRSQTFLRLQSADPTCISAWAKSGGSLGLIGHTQLPMSKRRREMRGAEGFPFFSLPGSTRGCDPERGEASGGFLLQCPPLALLIAMGSHLLQRTCPQPLAQKRNRPS